MISLIIWFILACFSCFAQEDLLTQANALYQQGMQPTTLLERQQAFNQALALYIKLEEEHEPLTQSGRLYQAIGDTYVQLSAYPWAILYYNRALKLSPHDLIIQTSLMQTQEKLGLKPHIDLPLLEQVLSFKGYLSLPQRLEFVFWLTVLTLFIASLTLWFPFSILKKSLYGLVFLTSVGLLNLIFSFYLVSLEAILISSTGLYREPDFNQPQLTLSPLQAGAKVQVMGIENQWFKIVDPEGKTGYVPSSAIRII